jgi:hypothetical protein
MLKNRNIARELGPGLVERRDGAVFETTDFEQRASEVARFLQTHEIARRIAGGTAVHAGPATTDPRVPAALL